MKNINNILHRISILYYVFLALYIALMIYSMSLAIINALGANKSSYIIEPYSIFMSVLMITWFIVLLVVVIWSIVMFIKLLKIIGKSIKRKNIFNLRTVKLINYNAILSIILIVLMFITEVSFKTGIDKESLSLFEDMMAGMLNSVMMLIFGQVLKIGYLLKQEQELTI